jgi:hypothetical protein
MDDTLPAGPNPEPESVLGKTLAEGAEMQTNSLPVLSP